MTQPTMRQVAERAGVSVALVSLVMRNAPNVSDRRRALVLQAADDLGYRPNVLARNLASRRTRTLGIVVNDLHNPFFAEVVDGVQSAVSAHGYRMLIGTGQHSRRGEAAAIETFLQFRVDGLILAGPVVAADAMERAARSAPVVAIGRTVASTMLDTVNNDDAIGARLAVEHLVALGHRRIAHIGGGVGAGGAARLAGYHDAMHACGLGDHLAVVSGDFSEAGGAAAAQSLLASRQRPTAVFAANDLSAAGALNHVVGAGVRVPDDMSFVGYDNTGLAAMQHMSLTSVDQPRALLGEIATNLLLERLDHGRTGAVHHVLAPTLVVRRSSAPPPSS